MSKKIFFKKRSQVCDKKKLKIPSQTTRLKLFLAHEKLAQVIMDKIKGMFFERKAINYSNIFLFL